MKIIFEFGHKCFISMVLLSFVSVMFCPNYAESATPEEAKWLNESDIQKIGYSPDPTSDGIISVDDLKFVMTSFGKNTLTDRKADLNKDGIVNILDLVLVSKYFGWSVDTIASVLTPNYQFNNNLSSIVVNANEPIKNGTIKLYNESGSLVREAQPFSSKTPVSFGRLDKGNYTAAIHAEDTAGNKTDISYNFAAGNPVDKYLLVIRGFGRPDFGLTELVDTLTSPQFGYNSTVKGINTFIRDPQGPEQINPVADQLAALIDSNDFVVVAIESESDYHGGFQIGNPGVFKSQAEMLTYCLKTLAKGEENRIYFSTCGGAPFLKSLYGLPNTAMIANGSTTIVNGQEQGEKVGPILAWTIKYKCLDVDQNISVGDAMQNIIYPKYINDPNNPSHPYLRILDAKGKVAAEYINGQWVPAFHELASKLLVPH